MRRTLAAGKVQFNAANTGKGAHEMGIFKTDKDPASLPVSKGKVDEGALGQKLGELEGLGAGAKKSGTFDLTRAPTSCCATWRTTTTRAW